MLKVLIGKFINDDGIKCLKNYKYKTSTYTFMDNAMQGWWNFFVSFIPLVSYCIHSDPSQSVAPNLLTLIGLGFPLSATLLILNYDTTMTVRLPVWLNLWSAFSIFMYQTLDAIDGK
jgi:hypothetical protein